MHLKLKQIGSVIVLRSVRGRKVYLTNVYLEYYLEIISEEDDFKKRGVGRRFPYPYFTPVPHLCQVALGFLGLS